MAKQIQKVLIPELVEVQEPGAAKLPQVAEPRHPAPVIGRHVPLLIAQLGTKGKKRFTTFFTDNIRNVNTRQAYFRAAFQFFAWCDAQTLGLRDIESIHVAAYREVLIANLATSSVKQHLAAIRKLFDWLIIGQVVATNPAHAVRGPRHVVTEGLTPILSEEDAKALIASIDVSHVIGLRDRALIALMISMPSLDSSGEPELDSITGSTTNGMCG